MFIELWNVALSVTVPSFEFWRGVTSCCLMAEKCDHASWNESHGYFLRFRYFCCLVHSIYFSLKWCKHYQNLSTGFELWQCKVTSIKKCLFEKARNKVFNSTYWRVACFKRLLMTLFVCVTSVFFWCGKEKLNSLKSQHRYMAPLLRKWLYPKSERVAMPLISSGGGSQELEPFNTFRPGYLYISNSDARSVAGLLVNK